MRGGISLPHCPTDGGGKAVSLAWILSLLLLLLAQALELLQQLFRSLYLLLAGLGLLTLLCWDNLQLLRLFGDRFRLGGEALVFATVVSAMILGICSGYVTVSGILRAMSRRPAKAPATIIEFPANVAS